MAALTFTHHSLRPARFERLLLAASDMLRTWAVRRMVRRHCFERASDHRRDLQSQMRLLP